MGYSYLGEKSRETSNDWFDADSKMFTSNENKADREKKHIQGAVEARPEELKDEHLRESLDFLYVSCIANIMGMMRVQRQTAWMLPLIVVFPVP